MQAVQRNEVDAPAADTAAVVTLTPEVDEVIVIDQLTWSYDATPTGGRLTVTIGGDGARCEHYRRRAGLHSVPERFARREQSGGCGHTGGGRGKRGRQGERQLSLIDSRGGKRKVFRCSGESKTQIVCNTTARWRAGHGCLVSAAEFSTLVASTCAASALAGRNIHKSIQPEKLATFGFQFDVPKGPQPG